MIQLLFDADDAAEALAREPVSVGYSQHEGAERADWDDEKLELVDGRRPVVYPAAGSHANFFDPALFVGSSGEQGVGCDDTRGPHLELEPKVVTIPSDAAAARRALPVDHLRGPLGELQDAFFNGPTGPNLKTQWTEPITWSEGWRRGAYAVPTGGVFGTGATDFFCQAVASGLARSGQVPARPGSDVARPRVRRWRSRASRIARATWRPVAPLRVARRRTWGQVLSAAGRMYVKRARSVPRDRASADPARPRHLDRPGARARRLRARSESTRTGEGAGALVLLLLAIGTHPDAARARARPGGHRLRARSGSTRRGDRSGRGVSRALWLRSGRCSAPSASPSPSGSLLTATAFLLPVAL